MGIQSIEYQSTDQSMEIMVKREPVEQMIRDVNVSIEKTETAKTELTNAIHNVHSSSSVYLKGILQKANQNSLRMMKNHIMIIRNINTGIEDTKDNMIRIDETFAGK